MKAENIRTNFSIWNKSKIIYLTNRKIRLLVLIIFLWLLGWGKRRWRKRKKRRKNLQGLIWIGIQGYRLFLEFSSNKKWGICTLLRCHTNPILAIGQPHIQTQLEIVSIEYPTGRQRIWYRVNWLAMRCCSAKQSCKKPLARPPVFFLVQAVEHHISLSNYLPASSASACSLSPPSLQEFLYRTRALWALDHNSLRIWKVVNKVLTGDLQTTYRDIFVMIFAVIETNLVYMFLDTPDFPLLVDTLLANLWGLKRCQERSNKYQPR